MSAHAEGELDPNLACNATIVNLARAPRNRSGRVEYSTRVDLLIPRVASRANGRLLFEIPNRGRKFLFTHLCGGDEDQQLTSIEALGNALPLKLGFVIGWIGWESDASRNGKNLFASVPVATDSGRPIVQVVREEFAIESRHPASTPFRLSYESASVDPSSAHLTVRRHQGKQGRELADWSFVDHRTIRLLPGTAPEPGDIYELHYSAKDPGVLGIGFAATRDLASYLRRSEVAEELFGGAISKTLAFGISQAGRFLRDFVGGGFNCDESGRKVLDGVLIHSAGAGGVFLNYAFGQPFRTCSAHEDFGFPENRFPFSPAITVDPLSGQALGLFKSADTDPLAIFTNTSSEYWIKGASLLHTSPAGTEDLALPAECRVYLLAGTQHSGRAGLSWDEGPCKYPRNAHDPMPMLRALLVALDEWVSAGRSPPESKVPSISQGTLVSPQEFRFPAIPGVAAPAARQIRAIDDWVRPKFATVPYPCLVPRVDACGNEVAGILSPYIRVPTGTYTGWNVYKPPFPSGEIADRFGSFIAFAKAEDERVGSGDPRPSLAARYGNRERYKAMVAEAAESLAKERLLLEEDVRRYLSLEALADPF